MPARGQIIVLQRVREEKLTRPAVNWEGDVGHQAQSLAAEMYRMLRQVPGLARYHGGIGRPDEFKPS